MTLVTLLIVAPAARAADADGRLYELRVYYAAPGKLEALHARFRDHTLKLFEKHGIENVGYWVPEPNPDNRLVYIVAHKSREAATASWKAFVADEDWKAAFKASEVNGKLAARMESFYLTPTDYSPRESHVPSGTGRAFELRTYITPSGKLDALNARFRNHTTKLFEKHGMTNVGYGTLAKDDKTTVGRLLAALTPQGQETADADPKAPAAPVALVYLLAHSSPQARDKSFNAFRADPAWVAAKAASEAGGSLTVEDGVKSLMMKATDYSPMK